MSAREQTFGVTEFVRAENDVSARGEAIRLLGYTIVPDVLSPEQLELARTKLDRVLKIQIEESGGEDRLRRIGDTNNARMLLAYDDFFLSIAVNPVVLPIVQSVLGSYVILNLQSGVFNVPGHAADHNAAAWHRDLNYQHFICSRPLAVSALLCIDDFSPTTGGTHLLPATHKTEAFPSEDVVASIELVAQAPAGAAIVFDSMLFHRGGLNRSSGVRRAINHVYTLPLIKQQISFPRMLAGKFRDDPFLAKFLGYESETGDDVMSWREHRIERAGLPADRAARA